LGAQFGETVDISEVNARKVKSTLSYQQELRSRAEIVFSKVAEKDSDPNSFLFQTSGIVRNKSSEKAHIRAAR